MKTYQETFLSPIETQISVEGWLTSTRNIDHPNMYGNYVFEFVTLNPHDHFRIEELVHSSLMRAGHFRNIEMTDMTTDDGKAWKVNQLFTPKLNREFEYPGQMEHSNDPVSLNLHLRDDKHGNIYLQCSYLDFYEQPEREIVEPPPGYDPDDDF